MKNILILISIFFIVHPAFSQDYFNIKKNHNNNHLVIVHPTEANMDRYAFLIENNILNPGKKKIVGLYFESEEYNYEEVINKYPEIGFHEIPTGLSKDNIYSENSKTEEFKKIFKYSSGIIFNGGPDIPPSTYGEEKMNLTQISDPWRHYYELSFLFHLLGGSQNLEYTPLLKKRPKYMILGICLGLQSMNVATGGTLIQDIPYELYDKNTAEEVLRMDKKLRHRNYNSEFRIYPDIQSYYLHPIKLTSGRWLDAINTGLNPNPYISSSHHQAIEKLGKEFRITATSMDDKVIEGIEHTKYQNVIGIQFHPEVDNLYKDDKIFQFNPEESKFSLLQKMNDLESYEFHVRFWENIMKSMP